MAYKKPGGKTEESERLREEGDKIVFIDNQFERGKVIGLGKGRRRQYVP